MGFKTLYVCKIVGDLMLSREHSEVYPLGRKWDKSRNLKATWGNENQNMNLSLYFMIRTCVFIQVKMVGVSVYISTSHYCLQTFGIMGTCFM